MKLFNFIQQRLRHKKDDDREATLPPVEEIGIPAQIRYEEKGNGRPVDNRLITIREPHSISSEQFRVLCTRVSQLLQQKSSCILAITSSVKGEGKTSTALNLAIAMARDFGERVLLIEGDLKNPDLHEYLKYPPGFGLSDVLEGKVEFESSCIRLFEGRLSVILAGKTTGNPAKLLSSHKFQEIINYARDHYKYIIIDTPPIMPLADVNIYSTHVDGILLIIRAGKTPRSIVKKALSNLSSEKVVGIILNEVEPNYSKYYYASKYSY